MALRKSCGRYRKGDFKGTERAVQIEVGNRDGAAFHERKEAEDGRHREMLEGILQILNEAADVLAGHLK
nr:hypothetical protein [uncultured Acetatifactor sp.]